MRDEENTQGKRDSDGRENGHPLPAGASLRTRRKQASPAGFCGKDDPDKERQIHPRQDPPWQLAGAVRRWSEERGARGRGRRRPSGQDQGQHNWGLVTVTMKYKGREFSLTLVIINKTRLLLTSDTQRNIWKTPPYNTGFTIKMLFPGLMFQYVLLNKKKMLITLKTFYLIKGHMWKESFFTAEF